MVPLEISYSCIQHKQLFYRHRLDVDLSNKKKETLRFSSKCELPVDNTKVMLRVNKKYFEHNFNANIFLITYWYDNTR